MRTLYPPNYSKVKKRYLFICLYIMECSICLEPFVDECVTNCNHKYCMSCLKLWFDKKHISCPMCRENIISYIYNNEEYEVLIWRNIIL